MLQCRGKTVEEVWNAIHTAEKRKERNGTSTPPLDQQQTVGSFLQSIGAIDFGAGDSGIPSGLPSLPSGFLPPAPELQVGIRAATSCWHLCHELTRDAQPLWDSLECLYPDQHGMLCIHRCKTCHPHCTLELNHSHSGVSGRRCLHTSQQTGQCTSPRAIT